MKKTTITLTTLGLLAILSCGLVGYLSCRQEQVNNCSNCQITSQEESQLSAYATGDKAVFKNDTTGAIDTLGISSKSETLSFCSYPCNNTEISLSVRGNFLNNSFTIFISHNSPPGSAIPYIGFSGIDVTFPLGGTMQSMTINSISYNDVFTTSIDSTKIPSDERNYIPWKINYSKSIGIIRCYMVNGQTWSKQ